MSRQPEPPPGWVYPGEPAKLARPVRPDAMSGNGRQPEPPIDRVATQAALDTARADLSAARSPRGSVVAETASRLRRV